MEVVKRCLNKLKEKNGNMYIYSAALIMCVMMMFAGIYEIIHVFTVVRSVRDVTEQAVVAVADNNSYNSFIGIKEGNTYANVISTDDVKHRLSALLSLEDNNGTLEKNIRGVWQYSIKNLSVEYENADVANETNTLTLNFETTLLLEVSIRFGNNILPPIQKKVTVRSSYTPMF